MFKHMDIPAGWGTLSDKDVAAEVKAASPRRFKALQLVASATLAWMRSQGARAAGDGDVVLPFAPSYARKKTGQEDKKHAWSHRAKGIFSGDVDKALEAPNADDNPPLSKPAAHTVRAFRLGRWMEAVAALDNDDDTSAPDCGVRGCEGGDDCDHKWHEFVREDREALFDSFHAAGLRAMLKADLDDEVDTVEAPVDIGGDGDGHAAVVAAVNSKLYPTPGAIRAGFKRALPAIVDEPLKAATAAAHGDTTEAALARLMDLRSKSTAIMVFRPLRLAILSALILDSAAGPAEPTFTGTEAAFLRRVKDLQGLRVFDDDTIAAFSGPRARCAALSAFALAMGRDSLLHAKLNGPFTDQPFAVDLATQHLHAVYGMQVHNPKPTTAAASAAQVNNLAVLADLGFPDVPPTGMDLDVVRHAFDLPAVGALRGQSAQMKYDMPPRGCDPPHAPVAGAPVQFQNCRTGHIPMTDQCYNAVMHIVRAYLGAHGVGPAPAASNEDD
jgi:hypothetical protein